MYYETVGRVVLLFKLVSGELRAPVIRGNDKRSTESMMRQAIRAELGTVMQTWYVTNFSEEKMTFRMQVVRRECRNRFDLYN